MCGLRHNRPWFALLPNKHDEDFGWGRASVEGIVPRLRRPNKGLSSPVRQRVMAIQLYGHLSFQHVVRAGEQGAYGARSVLLGQSRGGAW